MRSDSKIPPLGTIVNGRQYIEFIGSRYVSGHKRNFIKVKCLKCGLEVEIESKGFFNYGCRCVRLEEKKRKRHGFQSIDNPELHRFYNIWCGILTRCKGTAGPQWRHLYFGKGIKCERNSFEEFKDDMRESYKEHVDLYGEKNTTIDRINGNLNYCKENCRWATCKEQSENTSLTLITKVNGKEYRTSDIMTITGCGGSASRVRLKKYINGQITKEQLFAPKRYTSIYPPTTTAGA